MRCALTGGKHHDHDYEDLRQASESTRKKFHQPIENQVTIMKEALAQLNIHVVERYPTSEQLLQSTYMSPSDDSRRSSLLERQTRLLRVS